MPRSDSEAGSGTAVSLVLWVTCTMPFALNRIVLKFEIVYGWLRMLTAVSEDSPAPDGSYAARLDV